MIYKLVALSAVLAAGTWLSFPACAGDLQVVNGVCEASSHTAEGTLGADLTKTAIPVLL